MTIKRVCVVGGGIGGLSAVAALQRVRGITNIILMEKHPEGPKRSATASGIALWRNSLQCFDQIGALDRIATTSQLMNKKINYFNQSGKVLAAPPASFSSQIPVLCLHREDLQAHIFEHIQEEASSANIKVDIYNGTTPVTIQQHDQEVHINDSNGETHNVDLLIGADGIHSTVRNSVLTTPVKPKYCGYCYYRATLQSDDPSFHQNAFELWGDGVRFGYVPLKSPDLFWFLSLPSPSIFESTQERYTTRPISQDEASLVFSKMKQFYTPFDSGTERLIKETALENILRTDIYKIPVLPNWYKNRIALLGDAVHATSPNIAQGAGLAIEDAFELASSVRLYNQDPTMKFERLLEQYQARQIKRATRVQRMADTLGYVGQLKVPLSSVRDSAMNLSTSTFPGLEEKIFFATAEASLGGKWVPPVDKPLWEVILGRESFQKLSRSMKAFRELPGGTGTGVSSFTYSNWLYKWIGTLSGFPRGVENEKFVASVERVDARTQLWTRKFGNVRPAVYSTQMSFIPSSDNVNSASEKVQFRYHLTEKSGPITFVYDVEVGKSDSEKDVYDRAQYRSKELYLFGVKLPKCLAPRSEWEEIATPTPGWSFDGVVYLPVIGKFFTYKGVFKYFEDK